MQFRSKQLKTWTPVCHGQTKSIPLRHGLRVSGLGHNKAWPRELHYASSWINCVGVWGPEKNKRFAFWEPGNNKHMSYIALRHGLMILGPGGVEKNTAPDWAPWAHRHGLIGFCRG
jgi:hypothetical protein